MSITKKAKESQNQTQFDTYAQKGGVVLGPYGSHIWRHDPRHLCFLLSRYKFVSKMLAGEKKVLEVGCGDSTGTPIILQTVETVCGIDFESLVIDDNRKRNEYGERCRYDVHDMTESPLGEKFSAAFAMDVIEHVPAKLEDAFIGNIVRSLDSDGVLLIGTPNITAHQYASEGSRSGHINLKSGDSLRKLMSKWCSRVFLFSMNDEVVHTGFSPMANYLIGMGCGVKLS